MKPLNVLYLIRTWALGGSHTIVFLLMNHLPRDRFRIIPVVYDSHSGGDEKFVQEAKRQGFDVAPERIPWKTRRAWGVARDRVAELIKRYQVDILHTHDPHSNVLIGIGRSRWECACVASAYGWWHRWFPLRIHAHIWAERHLALPCFDRVITVSQNMKNKILRGPTDPERIRIIRTGLDVGRLKPHHTRREIRESFTIPEHALVVGTVSRIYVEKGHTYLLRACAALSRQQPDLYLLIVGEGPLRPALEEEARKLGIADRVRFTGFYDDVAGVMTAMDIFALPSILDEGFPTVVLEAQMLGVPVIASNTGGTSETMDVPHTGLLVPPKDASALARAIVELAQDASRRRLMGEAGQQWIRTSFTLEDMIEQVGCTYEEALTEYQNRHEHRH